MAAHPRLSIVIPTLNAAATLAECLRALEDGVREPDSGLGPAPERLGAEVIVADGGSSDGTPELAEGLGARVLHLSANRGAQLAAGAAAATGAWLLFLHADTRLAPGWAAAVERFLGEPGNIRRAAAFRFALDDGSPGARRIEALVDWRCRVLKLPYGDQGLLISRAFHDEIGGFRPLALMEDVDLVRRIGRGRVAVLDVTAVTSAARYRAGGYWLRPLRNLTCLGLFLVGVPPRLIARLYA
jgi:rSAM/selenodomain-associated transferase 2